ncbi:MAG: element excision factor XisI family protein [Phototrophicaceae bacterium]|jgi:hypothetical protein
MEPATLTQILKEEMASYAGKGLNAISYLTVNADETVFSVVDIGVVRDKRIVWTPLIARIEDNKIIIELERNEPPLVESLRAHGVQDDQIVLNYLHPLVTATS